MKAVLVSLVLVAAVTTFSSIASGQAAARKPQLAKVGQIWIVGNTRTRQNVILGALPSTLAPGTDLRYTDLRKAEKNLERLGIFAIDRGKGIRPTVSVLDAEGENPYKDILVQVEETSTSSLRLMAGVNSRGEPVVSIVWEERNFDLERWPTSREDLMSGDAFRGAGQRIRLELLQIPVLRVRNTCLFQRGRFRFSFGDWSIQGMLSLRWVNNTPAARRGSCPITLTTHPGTKDGLRGLMGATLSTGKRLEGKLKRVTVPNPEAASAANAGRNGPCHSRLP